MSIWPRFRVTNYSPNSYRLFRTDKHRHATRPLSRETTTNKHLSFWGIRATRSVNPEARRAPDLGF